MSAQPPAAPGQPQLPEPGSLRCPRCSATLGPEQDWCLECGAPARTRLAQTPNWQLPTAAIGAIVLVAGALLAFAFVKLTDDGDAPVGSAPTTAVTTPATVPPPVVVPVPTATAPPPTTLPSTTPTGTTPTVTSPPPATTTPTTTSTGAAPPPALAPRTTAPPP